MKTMNKENAKEYEYQCMIEHQEKQNQKTWHWNHVPEDILYESGFIPSYRELRLKRRLSYEKDGIYYNLMREYGLDGISMDMEKNIYHGIQCKLWDKKVSILDLKTFYDVIENRMRVKDDKSIGYLYHAGLITKSLSDDFKKKGYLKNIHLPLKIKNEEEIKEENEELKKEDEYELREYQEEAMEALRGVWDGVQLLNLPCGTGKTLIIGNHCKEKRYKKVFIFSPTRVLTKQNMERMKRFLEDYEDILVDCDDEGTRNIDDIEKIMVDEEEKSYIISSTYTSAKDVIRELFNEEEDEEEDEYECKYDLSDSILIVDEAHNLINLDDLMKVVRSFPKVILMTATPPQEMEEEIGCCTIYNYSLKRGIEEGYICDYEIYLPMLIKKDIGAGQEEKGCGKIFN